MDINSEKTIEKIGELDFLDTKVPIFYDPKGGDRALISWGIRNPSSEYKGIIYYNPYTGKHKLPDGVEIPKQTEKDRENLPKFIIIGRNDMDNFHQNNRKYLDSLILYLESGYRTSNPKLWREYQIDRIFSI